MIGSGFKTFIDWIEDPTFPCLIEKRNVQGVPGGGVPTNEADLFDGHDHWAGQSKIVYYHTYLQFLVFFQFMEQTQKPRYESG